MRFVWHLVITVLTVCVLACLSLAFLISCAQLIATAVNSGDKETEPFYFIGSLLVGGLAALITIVLWKNVRNKALFPSCLCNAVIITSDELVLRFVFFGTCVLKKDSIGLIRTSTGFWIKADGKEKILIQNNTYGAKTQELFEKCKNELDTPTNSTRGANEK